MQAAVNLEILAFVVYPLIHIWVLFTAADIFRKCKVMIYEWKWPTTKLLVLSCTISSTDVCCNHSFCISVFLSTVLQLRCSLNFGCIICHRSCTGGCVFRSRGLWHTWERRALLKKCKVMSYERDPLLSEWCTFCCAIFLFLSCFMFSHCAV